MRSANSMDKNAKAVDNHDQELYVDTRKAKLPLPRRNRTATESSATLSGRVEAISHPSSAKVKSLPAIYSAPQAFELLAQQPVSLVGMTQEQRNAVVVTAVSDDAGNEHVLSRLGDAAWDLSPEMPHKNRATKHKIIYWPSNVPQDLVDDAKAVLYCALRQGRNGQSYSASSTVSVGKKVGQTLRYLAKLGVKNFSEVRSLYVTDHIATLKESLKPTTIGSRMSILDLVWFHGREVIHPLPEHPFAGKALYEAVGRPLNQNSPDGQIGRTPVIPPKLQKILWAQCANTLDYALRLFEERDAGQITMNSDKLIDIRTAVLYQLQICSGMRNSESTGVTNRCWRQEDQIMSNGHKVTFHWVTTREFKTTGGKEVDFLVPPEAFKSLEILQRYAEPLQRRLADEAIWLEKLLRESDRDDRLLSNGVSLADAVMRLNHVREISTHLLLNISLADSDHLGQGSRVEVMSVGACDNALKKLAKSAGLDWELTNHQCRRTFAYNVANSRLGRMGLVFIKWQFKHASISWTQLYASNPRQDQALYDEFNEALFESKVELLEAWNNADVLLSGGAGKKLMQTRAMPVKDFKQLLSATAASVNLRSTGHAWCMSGTNGCRGQGVYDPIMCGGCSQAVIDESQGTRWQMIHLDSLRLASIMDCGPAVELKAKRAVEMSTQVLLDLGVPFPTKEQAHAYEKGAWVE